MNEQEGLNLLDFLAAGINAEDPAIQAVLSDEQGEGAVANEVEALVKFIGYYTRTDDVKNHRGYTLEMIVKLFANLRRRIVETDEVLLRRFLALTERKGDCIWGNALNLKHVFETYFKGITCFVAENTGETSLLSDGGFEPGDAWTIEGNAGYSYDARFSGRRGLYFDGTEGSGTQRLERLLAAGTYTFHFFLKGICGLRIQREDGKYWNANDQQFTGDEVLAWVDDEVINRFEKPDGWDNAFCFIKIPKDLYKIVFTFVSITGKTACIDYARLFAKPLHSSYTLVFQYEGYFINDKTLHLEAAGEDPIPEITYENARYFDHAFIVGPAGISQSRAFKTVLDAVRPRGIQAFAEFVEKHIVEQEERAVHGYRNSTG